MMSLLTTLKYFIEHFQGTVYEPYMKALLCVFLTVRILFYVKNSIGVKGLNLLLNIAPSALEKFRNRRGYAPEFEKFRLRIAPYLDFWVSLCFAFAGIYLAFQYFIIALVIRNKAPFWGLSICMVVIFGGLFYMRINLESASWAYHKMKTRQI